MSEVTRADPVMTIDDLARRSLLPVRTIREYHTMRLLPPPARRGRVGIYGQEHVQRLELIARLQRRGYSLAGIRDLVEAWDAGADLTSVLGVEPSLAALDETPLRLSPAELRARAPALSGPLLSEACAVGLVKPAGKNYLVRSPALLALVADGAAAGVPLPEMLKLVGVLQRELTSLAGQLADLIVDRLLPAQRSPDQRSPAQRSPDQRSSAQQSSAQRSRQEPGDLVPLLQRGRLLLLQGAASALADGLGTALLQRADQADDRAALRAAVERIRVGAVADSAGRIEPAVR